MEPIYPAVRQPAASGGERQVKAPEPAEPQGWFYRAEASEERAAESSADSKPPAAADQARSVFEPAAEAATGSAAQVRTARSGAPGTAGSPAGKAGGKPDRGGPGSAADAGAAGSGGGPGAASPVDLGGAPPDREVTVVPGVPRYHRPGCSTISFMDDSDLEKRTLKSAAEAGCAPCEACQAGAPDPAPAGG